METKYEGVHAQEISTWINDGIVENVKGFRLVRKMRGQLDEPSWCTIEVRGLFVAALFFGRYCLVASCVEPW